MYATTIEETEAMTFERKQGCIGKGIGGKRKANTM